jgi:hypothetical protein
MGIRSIRTGFPARVSSYRSGSMTNCPNCTLSEGMFSCHSACNILRPCLQSCAFVLQAIYRRSPLCPTAFGGKIPHHLGGANAPSKKNLEAP